jgi:hypothetical protein
MRSLGFAERRSQGLQGHGHVALLQLIRRAQAKIQLKQASSFKSNGA